MYRKKTIRRATKELRPLLERYNEMERTLRRLKRDLEKLEPLLQEVSAKKDKAIRADSFHDSLDLRDLPLSE